MRFILRLSTAFALLLLAACNNDKGSDGKSSSSSTFSCSFSKSGELTLCTQYEGLSGSTLTSIQSECELQSNQGYSWAAAACAGNSVGRCELKATAQRPSAHTQFFYGAAFSSGETASVMCGQQGGTYSK